MPAPPPGAGAALLDRGYRRPIEQRRRHTRGACACPPGEVRAGFKERDLHYDAALAGLDLAALWLRQGETKQLALLTIEMAATFRRLRLPNRDAWTALRVLKLACGQGVASVTLIERVQEFLTRHKADPGHRLDLQSLVG